MGLKPVDFFRENWKGLKMGDKPRSWGGAGSNDFLTKKPA
jgi:hypothetical protein